MNKKIIFVLLFSLIIISIPQVFGGTWTGDFEIGNFSRWDSTSEGWSINTNVVRNGTYSAKWDWSSPPEWSSIIKSFSGNVNNESILTFFVYFEDLNFPDNKLQRLIHLHNFDYGTGGHPLAMDIEYLDEVYEWYLNGKTYDFEWKQWGCYPNVEVDESHWYNITIDSNCAVGLESLKVYVDNELIAGGPTTEGTIKLIDCFRIGGWVTYGSVILYIDDVTFTSEPIKDDKYEPPEPWEFDWSWLKWLLVLMVLIIIVSFALYVKYGDDKFGF